MEYIIYNSGGELYHHGVKGMKWGQRLYQRKDGSLTALGKKRRAAEKADLKEREKTIKRQERNNAERDKIAAKKAELDAREKALKRNNKDESTSQTPKVKSVSEMSDKELQAHTNRMQLEANYYNAQRNLANATPKEIAETKQTSKGKELAQKFFKDNVLPAVGNATKTALEGYLKKQLGLETKDELAELKRMADILDAKQRIDKHKNPDKYLSWDDKKKKREYEDETAKREAAAKKKADDEAAERRAYEETNEPYTNPRSDTPPYSGYRSGPNNTSKSNGASSSETESYVTRLLNAPAKEGKVEGIGNSSKKNTNSGSKQNSAKSDVIDAEPYELMTIGSNTASRINTMTSSGKYTNAEIAKQLGVSTSTVSKYSNGRNYVDKMMTYDEDGKFIGYWSERMTADGFI